MMAKAARNAKWCFTLNNYTEEEYKLVMDKAQRFNPSYLIVGKEVGEKGTPHLQGYINLGNKGRRSLLQMKTLSARAHWEVARGSDMDSQKYCSKEGDFVEHGAPQTAGARNDLKSACDILKEKKSVAAVAREMPSTYVKYHRGFEALNAIYTDDDVRDFKTKVTVLVGKPGTGKSRYALEVAKKLYPDSIYYKPRGEWWDGYDGHKCVIIDDYYGWLKYDELLKICDRYPYRVPIKGGFRQFRAQHIFFTSNVEINKWYKFDGFTIDAISRRIDEYFVDEIPQIAPEPENVNMEQQLIEFLESSPRCAIPKHAAEKPGETS